MSNEIIKVPDIGGSEDVEVIEISVKAGDRIKPEDTLIVLESDKASMDIPSPVAGVVKQVLLKEGDKVSEGAAIIEVEIEGAAAAPSAPKAEAPVAAAPAAPVAAPAPVAAAPAAPVAAAAPAGRQEVRVPDLGGHASVEIIEVTAKAGDVLKAEDGLITLETDKATMDVPSPFDGKLVELLVKLGDKVSEGDLIGYIEVVGAVAAPAAAPKVEAPVAAPAAAPAPVAAAAPAGRQEVRVPDLGGHASVEIIEVTAKAGDVLKAEDGLITLETDKATMDVPSPFDGKLVELLVKVGDKVSEGDLIGYIEVVGAVAAPAAAPVAAATAAPAAPVAAAPVAASSGKPATSGKVHAGPAVRMLARELGADLSEVKGSGPKGRILKEDLQNFVKQILQQSKAAPKASGAVTGGAGIPPVPVQDFSQFGEIEEKPMGRLLKAGAVNLHRSWLNVPHVTQFDEADITELEEFRKAMKVEAEKQGAKLTPLPFLIKACALALKAYPQFNVSLGAQGDTLIWKKYINVGFAVDTPDGLLVVVVKDADKKSIYELARESSDLASRAQKKQLKGEDMKGSCFTISSLGSIGGTAFTPIVNAPEVAILGVSKSSMKPVWDGKAFQPRLILPLSLSYDHRAINGADAARFTSFLAQELSDIRKMLL